MRKTRFSSNYNDYNGSHKPRRRWFQLRMPLWLAKIVIPLFFVLVILALIWSIARPASAAMRVSYQKRVVVRYGDTERKIILSTKVGRSGEWNDRVIEPFNRDCIRTFGTPVGFRAAKAVRAVLRKAADMSWGATLSCMRREANVVTWKVGFHHWYREEDGLMRHFSLPDTVKVQARMTKAGRIKVRYFINSRQVSRYSIETLLMRQRTTVNTAGLGTFVPDIR